MNALPDWKVHELRAAALCDLKDFIPEDFYANVYTSREAQLRDWDLEQQLLSKLYTNPHLTPRQLAAIRLFGAVVMFLSDKNLTPDELAAEFCTTTDEIEEHWITSLQDEVKHYTSYLSEGEASALAVNHETTESAKKTTLIEKRIAAIVDAAKRLGYDPLKVATGGKPKIKSECLKDSKLFTDSTFVAAWKEASKIGLVEVENKEIYRNR